jgi:LemA protein
VLILVVTILILMAILYPIVIYTRLTTKRSRQLNAWGQVDVDLKRRHDLIRSLVSSAREYLEHTDPVLDTASHARLNALEVGSDIPQRAIMESELTEATRSLLALIDGYEELKEHPEVVAVEHELATITERLTTERETYNQAVAEYNAAIRRFPGRYMAARLQLAPAVPYDQEETADRLQPWVLH